ncbi:NAD(P)/FAD-dependent oxidoreductase [Streptomyces armeniacus]|uniref:NAD(P)/FAD-dependent oxidoreductase n=1 Tax=Streptomyces armeniacus TaxID=83291 RepID=A0A345XXH8_9ACTN|nr:FAD-dependent oxidoreductase [Streptomyces armeniacus]AXK36344.1 NAD(P)/FAD-dependent oxidoreductase [Streptomyces armeniacus]
MRSVAVVGASLAGLAAARALRAQGYDGGITLIGDEPRAPYDRPPLSKDFLLSRTSTEELALTTDDDESLAVDWRLGTTATALDPYERRITLSDGGEVRADGVVIATGARARTLPGAGAPGAGGMSGVHTLRTLDDALALRESLRSGGPLVVIGAGFIGSEVASTALAAGLDVTVVEALPVPLAGPLGAGMGAVCAGLHTDHGVPVLCGVPVRELLGGARVEGVRLADGTVLPAATVLVGIGAEPNTDWLADSGLDIRDGVRTDARGATAVPHVVAAGDCAASYQPGPARHVRTEHWTDALRQPETAVRALLAGPDAGADTACGPLPYFWSEQYGVRIQFAGARRDGDSVRIESGDPEDRSFLAVYERDGRPTAVLGMDQPKQFTRWRRRLAADWAAVTT